MSRAWETSIYLPWSFRLKAFHMSGWLGARDGKLLRISVPLIAGIVIALCGLLLWQTDHLRNQQQWVEHSYQVRV